MEQDYKRSTTSGWMRDPTHAKEGNMHELPLKQIVQWTLKACPVGTETLVQR